MARLAIIASLPCDLHKTNICTKYTRHNVIKYKRVRDDICAISIKILSAFSIKILSVM